VTRSEPELHVGKSRRGRLREKVALAIAAAHRGEEIALTNRFDALGNDVEVQGVGQAQDALHNRPVVVGTLQISNEGEVDLQQVNRESLEVGER